MSQIKDVVYEPHRYLAFILDDQSRDKLLRLCPPSFDTTICHHVTILYHPSEKEFDEIQRELAKTDPVVQAVGILIGDKIEAIAVQVNGKTKRLDGKYYHVTLSLTKPAKPKDSNLLFSEKVKKIPFHKPVNITGEFQICK